MLSTLSTFYADVLGPLVVLGLCVLAGLSPFIIRGLCRRLWCRARRPAPAMAERKAAGQPTVSAAPSEPSPDPWAAYEIPAWIRQGVKPDWREFKREPDEKRIQDLEHRPAATMGEVPNPEQIRDSITLSRCLKRLRDFLEGYQRKPAEAPAYFSACGIGKIVTWLQEKPSQYQVLLESEQICPSLQGHWQEYWWQIFRSGLLLETYWPDETAAQLYEELRCSQEVIRAILAKYGIRVHSLGLLDKAALNKAVQDGFASSLDAELRNNAHFYETVKPRADKGRTYCDVGAWGYDIDGNVKKSTVIVLGPGVMW